MRCMALAQAVRSTGMGEATFLVRELGCRSLYEQVLVREGFEVRYLEAETVLWPGVAAKIHVHGHSLPNAPARPRINGRPPGRARGKGPWPARIHLGQ